MIYTFVLRKNVNTADEKPHSIWNGHKELPQEVVQHDLAQSQMISKLKEFGYTQIAYW